MNIKDSREKNTEHFIETMKEVLNIVLSFEKKT